MKSIYTKSAPFPVGPYSQGVRAGDMVFVSGQIPLDPDTGEIRGRDIKEQTKTVMENIRNILLAEGLGMESIVKTTIYLKDMQDFSDLNSVYAKYFNKPFPARACVEVSLLPKNAMLEIEALAYAGK